MKTLIAWLKSHHIMHTWGKWELTRYTYIPEVEGLPISSMKYEEVKLQRSCPSCGKIQNESL